MEKDRLVVFSDRVAAIAITLLIFDICLPHTDYVYRVSVLKEFFAEYYDVCA